MSIDTITCAANDGTQISFKIAEHSTSDTCIILIHGFSGSSEYFVRNLPELAKYHTVVAPDLRGHGGSGRPTHGYHVNRLAADLKDLITFLKASLVRKDCNFIGVGCSIGAAILWSYTELYTCKDFAKFVFVDQAPLQNYTANGDWDWRYGNYGCHDAASAAWNQASLILNFADANRGLVASCLGYRFQPRDGDAMSKTSNQEDEQFFTQISSQCDPEWIARLMGDHTQYDHRDTISRGVNVPSLIMAGERSGCFPVRGCFETARLINSSQPGLAETRQFNSGHWLFYEEAKRFNDELLSFVDR